MASLAKNTIVYLLGNIINRVGAFIMLPVYTQYLTVEEYGALELIYTTTAVLSMLLGAGLAHTTLRFYFDSDIEEERNRVISTNFFAALAISLFGASIVLLFSDKISAYLFDSSGLQYLIYYAVAIMLMELLNEILYAYIRAREYVMLFVVLSVARLLTQITLTLLFLVFMEYKIGGVLFANMLSVAVVFVYLFIFVFHRCGFTIEKVLFKPVFSYAIPFAASSVVGSVLVNADKIMLKHFYGLSSVGEYGLAVKFSMILSFLLIEPYQKSFGPYRFSIMKNPNANQIYGDVTYYVFVLSIIMYIGISLFTPDVLFVMSNSEYWESYNLVPILSLGVVFQALNYSFQTGILIEKKTNYLVRIMLVCAVLNVVSNLYWIPRMGTYGAAMTNFLTYALMAILTNSLSQKLRKVDYPYMRMFLTMLLSVPVVLYIYVVDQELSVMDVFSKIALISLYVLLLLAFDTRLRNITKEYISKLSFMKS